MKTDIFTDEMAELCKKNAGEPYRPSNGHEGELLFTRHCLSCKHNPVDEPCEIIMQSMSYDTSDIEYPGELIYSDCGQPQCTKREEL
jgi:hypothetical protein